MIELINGNCIDALQCIPDKSVDLILTDLPYGTTKNPWDTIIPLDALWAEWKRILRKDRTVALHSDMPFTVTLYQSNPKWWKYEWIWEKPNGTNFLGCKKHPLKNHESIQIFQNGKTRYFPQYGIGKPYQSGGANKRSENYGFYHTVSSSSDGRRYPKSVLYQKRDSSRLHPTQKPVELERYIIRTYTDEGETVLDCCMGSGTTGIAAKLEKRSFIGIELQKEYFDIAKQRIEEA